MKKSLQFILCTVFALGFFNASANIPELVKRQFAELYPGAKDTHWEALPEGYIASFQSSTGPKKAYFDEQGHWKESSLRLGTERMPAGVVRRLQVHHTRASEISYGVGYNRVREWYWAESVYPDRLIIQRFDESGSIQQQQTIHFSTAAKHGLIEAVFPGYQRETTFLHPTVRLTGLEWVAFDLKRHRAFMQSFSKPDKSDHFYKSRSGNDLSVALRRLNTPFQNVDYPFIIRFQI